MLVLVHLVVERIDDEFHRVSDFHVEVVPDAEPLAVVLAGIHKRIPAHRNQELVRRVTVTVEVAGGHVARIDPA